MTTPPPYRPVAYTEVESHRANLRERIKVLRLMWRTAAEEGIPLKVRWQLRLMALRTYVKPSARVSSYIVTGGVHDA